MFISKYVGSHTTSFKIRQDWTQQEHTAKGDRTGHDRNILQSATGLDTTGIQVYCKVRQVWTQQKHSAKCDRTGHNRNILQKQLFLRTLVCRYH
jgi:hypothetical protein